MSKNLMKMCPHCQTEKPAEAFYRIKNRKDGLASWCKECSNQGRKYHKPSRKKTEYRIVADVVLKEGKPTNCPSCGASDVPSHKMRGRVEKGKAVVWDCVECRNKSLEDERKVLWGCSWCCEEKMVTQTESHRVFCGSRCVEAWREGKRQAREQEEDDDGGDAAPVAV